MQLFSCSPTKDLSKDRRSTLVWRWKNRISWSRNIVISDHNLHSWLWWNISLQCVCVQHPINSIKIMDGGWCKCYIVASKSGPYLGVKSHSGWHFAGKCVPLWRENQRPFEVCGQLCAGDTIHIWDMIQGKEETSFWSLLCCRWGKSRELSKAHHCLVLPKTVKEERHWELICTIFLETELGWSTCFIC